MSKRLAFIAAVAVMVTGGLGPLSGSVLGKDTVLGTLTCTAVQGDGGQSENAPVALSCQFRAADGGYTEIYAGTLRMDEKQHPIRRSIVLMWTVAGEDVALAPGVLEQNYVSSGRDSDRDNRQLKGQHNPSVSLRPVGKNGETAEHTVTVLDLSLKRTGA